MQLEGLYRKAFEQQQEEEEKYLDGLFEEGKKIAGEVMELSKKVKGRNKTLFNLIWLLWWIKWGCLFRNSGDYDVRKYAPKRGRKGYFIPLKFVMAFLDVSHRTAQDYIRTIDALFKLERLQKYSFDIFQTMRSHKSE